MINIHNIRLFPLPLPLQHSLISVFKTKQYKQKCTLRRFSSYLLLINVGRRVIILFHYSRRQPK